jgi:hypothetical protein
VKPVHENQTGVWFTKNLGDAMLAGESLEHIKALFLSAYEQAGNADEMALYFRHESEGRLHCEVKIYFPPASASVAQAVDAIPCSKPSPESLGLLAGSEAAWPVLFP